MQTVRARQKLVCPYCKEKQAFYARDYFPYYSTDGRTVETQCEECDQFFNATLANEGTIVKTYTNMLSAPPT